MGLKSLGQTTNKLMVSMNETQKLMDVEMEELYRRTNISASTHQSGLMGRVVRQKPVLFKAHMTAYWKFARDR